MDFKERVRRRNEFDASLVYGTKKFNAMTGREEHLDYRQKHDNQWTNPKTGLVFDKFSEKRKCPLCHSTAAEGLFVKAGFPHVKCTKCGLVYVNRILNQREYKKLWRSEESWEKVLESEHQIKMQALEANYSLDIVKSYLKNKKDQATAICDVGCGPGTLLIAAKKKGYEVFGVEPNQRCHRFLEKERIPFIGEFFPLKTKILKKFDCVFLLNTLEHLKDPAMIIGEIRKILKPFGLIYISVPCIEALVNRIMHERAGVFGGHSHLQFFSTKTLPAFLKKTGFKVLEYETIITEIGVMKNYLDYQSPYFGGGNVDFDFLTPEFIYKNNLARNVNVVARMV
ncbi:MAG: class I SAM-dependent methyltransferase [Candidatus Omnitrophota bacterium]|nr:class I SAM-dependent methyltransferase [Candidatus Omnitrophota bacterium]